jgi:hypothetical protein
LEKIDKKLFSPCKYLNLGISVNLGRTGNNNVRLDGVYVKTYPTKKYSDVSTVHALSIETSEFLVLTYSRDKEFEQVYLSYPHMKQFVTAIQGINALVQSNGTEDNPLFVLDEDERVCMNSAYDGVVFDVKGLAQSKSIKIRPEVVGSRDGDSPGAVMYINNPAYEVEIDELALEALCYFVENFNLFYASQMLVNFAGLAVIDAGGGTISMETPSMETVTAPKRRSSNKSKETQE